MKRAKKALLWLLLGLALGAIGMIPWLLLGAVLDFFGVKAETTSAEPPGLICVCPPGCPACEGYDVVTDRTVEPTELLESGFREATPTWDPTSRRMRYETH